MLDTKLKNNKIVRSVTNCKSSTWIALLLTVCSLLTVGVFPRLREDWNYDTYDMNISFWDHLQNTLGMYYLAALAILALLAVFLPFFKKIRLDSRLVKRFPAELSILGIPSCLFAELYLISFCHLYAQQDPIGTDAIHLTLTFFVCMLLYGVWLLTVLSLLELFDMGAAGWFREKSFFYQNGKRIGLALSQAFRQFIRSLTSIDLGEGSDRWLIRAVLVNFLFLLMCCLFFGSIFFKGTIYFFGIAWCVSWVAAGLLVYSVLLFFILRRYLNRVKKEYQLLLFTAEQMAQGNLQMNEEPMSQENPLMSEEQVSQENPLMHDEQVSQENPLMHDKQGVQGNPQKSPGKTMREGSKTDAESVTEKIAQTVARAVNYVADKSKAGSAKELGIFEPLRKALADINVGFRRAVEEETRSQAMKTELITNVSHDLKTPLTAIITYVNLLKDESISGEERRSYVDILDRKSLRLKKLIEDLFEVSKAASGNIEVKKSPVDMGELIRQAVAEQQDRLQAAGIECRVITPDTSRLHVPGDTSRSQFSGSHDTIPDADAGRSGNTGAQDDTTRQTTDSRILLELDSEKTYRILENLLVNVAKYALPGTRAWVQLELVANEAVITVKNTSAAELNFDTSSLTDRFVRGDKSRTTEGSGLGLAIVQSFTELQGGRFEIATDGDLFKAIVRFPV
ncbi:MAG: ATP-binding protein [Lachnospiraceae bacterium]|nr:ATP-binding protein [Lachnospiraceae bacterium]